MTRPSLRLVDWLCLAALVALAAAWASRPSSHDDLFGHLRTGEWMAAHRTVPKVDPFSFTRPGARWVTHEWAFSLLAWAVWLAAGYPGLIVTRVALVLAVGAVVGWRMRAEAGTETPLSIPWIAALLGLGLWALAAELILRAALVSELFLALTLVFLARVPPDRPAAIPDRADRPLLPLGQPALRRHLRPLRPRPLRPLKERCGAPAEAVPADPGRAALASLINPNGIEVWLYPFRLSRLLFASGIAWDLGHFAAADPRTNTAFLILAVLLLAGLLPLEKIRELSDCRRSGRSSASRLSFRSPRFLFHFAILALPALYRLHVARPVRDWTPAMPRIAAAATILVLALTAATAWLSHPRRLITPQLRTAPSASARRTGSTDVSSTIRTSAASCSGGRTSRSSGRPERRLASLVQEVTTTPFPTIVERYGIDELLITEHELPGIQPEIPDRWAGRTGTTTAPSTCAATAASGRCWTAWSCASSPASAAGRASKPWRATCRSAAARRASAASSPSTPRTQRRSISAASSASTRATCNAPATSCARRSPSARTSRSRRRWRS